MKKLNIIYVTAILISIFFYACDSNSSQTASLDSLRVDTTQVTDSIKKADTSAKTVDTLAKETWRYSDNEDKMTSTKTFFANIDANEELLFDFPYDGGSTATICVRNMEHSNNVILSVSKGQFICSPSSGCSVRVRFDENKAETFQCSESSDYDPTTIFINSTSRFIKQCKTSKTMLIEAEFYHAGLKQMEFNVEGLKWDH